ncbi:hypothetical protein A0128_08670 [Leptospira tipperaryensis]|nr:hypothetical protein A0128_08670 [Leptospira tipperaryensis]
MNFVSVRNGIHDANPWMDERASKTPWSLIPHDAELRNGESRQLRDSSFPASIFNLHKLGLEAFERE